MLDLQPHNHDRRLATLLLLSLCLFFPPTARAATPATGPTALERLKAHMPVLKNDRGDRWPVLFWNPAPKEEAMMQAWTRRGVVPLSIGDWTDHPALPFLHYLQDHHLPVIFLAQGLVQNAFRQKGRSFGDPDSPAWLINNPRIARETHRAQALVQTLKSEGITPTSLWIDAEAGAYLRNAADRADQVRKRMQQAMNHPADVRQFGRQRLGSLKGYQAVVNQARAHLYRVAFTDPVHAVFPDCALGNYYAWPIDRAIARDPERYQGRYPAYGYEGSDMTVAQPRCYFTVAWRASAKASQDQINWNVFQYCLDRFSRAAQVLHPNEKLVPWVGYLFNGNGGGAKVSRRKAKAGGRIASSQAYREMVLHVMMRGAETLAVFSPATLDEPFAADYPADFPRRQWGPLLVNLVDIQQAYDQMLRFNKILRKGKILNYAVPDADHPGPVWSGVATDDKALVRTVTFGPQDVEKTIRVFDRSIKLPFGRTGRFFWIHPDGQVEPAP